MGSAPAGLERAVLSAEGRPAGSLPDGRDASGGVAGGLSARFGDSGPVIRVAGGALGLTLSGVGYPGALARVIRSAPESIGNRVVYRRGGGVTEWYRTERRGVEQGFTLTERPLGSKRTGPLTVALRVSGSLVPRMDGTGIVFGSARFPLARALRYGGLAVSDATGRRLSSRLELRQKRLLLLVDDRGATYPLRIDPFIQQGSKLAPAVGEVAATSNFGASVAMSSDGTTALVGSPFDSTSDVDEGAAWIFVKSNGVWTQLGPGLVPDDADNSYHGADFGESVALSADGSTALIGGSGDGNDAQGAAWVFTRSGGLWIQQGAKLIGGGGGNLAACGTSVALSADGNTALIGCPGESNSTGGVWVFTRADGTWTQQGPVLAGNDENTADAGPQFGRSVALASDGNTAIIGGSFDGSSDVGAAWVFTRTNGTWTQQGPKLTASDGVGGSSFGWSVALSADGNTALIGGYSDDSHAGAAWVFTRSGTAWAQQGPKLTGGGEAGWSVALSSDGDTALIGGPGPRGPGTASVYVRSAGTWTLQSGLTGTGEIGQGFFGGGVALSGDGSSALVGGSQSGEGALWAFTGSGGTWTQQGSPLVALASAQAGYAVALSADGNTALVGGPFGGPDNEGEAWVFIRSGSTWTVEADLTSCDGWFGAGVALSADGNTALIGCPEDGSFAGSAWVFTRSGIGLDRAGPEADRRRRGRGRWRRSVRCGCEPVLGWEHRPDRCAVRRQRLRGRRLDLHPIRRNLDTGRVETDRGRRRRKRRRRAVRDERLALVRRRHRTDRRSG